MGTSGHGKEKGGRRQSGRPPARLIRVLDPALLGHVVAALIDRHGSEAAASRAVNIPRATLGRMRELPDRIDILTADALQAALLKTQGGYPLLQSFSRAVEGIRMAEVYAAYEDWCAVQCNEVYGRETVPWEWHPHAPSPTLVRSARAAEDQRALRRHDLYTYVRQHFAAHHDLFEREMTAAGISSGRQLLAWVRILQPLLEGPESAFVERRFEELSSADAKRFISAGITRERILLLGRASDFDRAQEVASGTLRGRPGHHTVKTRRRRAP